MMSSGEWAKLDDDKVSLVKEDQILKLLRLEKMMNDLEEEKVCCMCELGGRVRAISLSITIGSQN